MSLTLMNLKTKAYELMLVRIGTQVSRCLLPSWGGAQGWAWAGIKLAQVEGTPREAPDVGRLSSSAGPLSSLC